MAATRIDEAERDATHAEVDVTVEPHVRTYDTRLVVHPRKEVRAALREPLLGHARREIGFALSVRPDFGAGFFQRLQSVDVVSVIVTDDDAPDRLRRDGADRGDHRAAEHRRAERIEDNDAIVGDDEAG